ncbi:MAG TPA: hypothetical protein VLH56_08485 [Dissulfurispiraceae bacterium]|nr:hypothetical protein [Dissulfurispiraceae bacterium]
MELAVRIDNEVFKIYQVAEKELFPDSTFPQEKFETWLQKVVRQRIEDVIKENDRRKRDVLLAGIEKISVTNFSFFTVDPSKLSLK